MTIKMARVFRLGQPEVRSMTSLNQEAMLRFTALASSPAVAESPREPFDRAIGHLADGEADALEQEDVLTHGVKRAECEPDGALELDPHRVVGHSGDGAPELVDSRFEMTDDHRRFDEIAAVLD